MRATSLHLLHPPNDPNGPSLTLAIVDREQRGDIVTGTVRAGLHGSYPINYGVLDLLGDDLDLSLAQRSNFLWPTSAFYEQVWRRRSLSLLAAEPFPVSRELALLNDWVRPERGGLYLDVGTSHGLYARNLANAFRTHSATGTVIAIDIAMAMLRHAGDLIARKGYTTIDRVRARAQALPLADGTVDGIVSGGTFNEMGDQLAAMREVHRTLAADGVFFAMSLTAARTPTGTHVQQALRAALGIIFPTQEETNAIFDAANLTITDQESHGIVLFTRATRRQDA